MGNSLNILVFPCGSEIGLEIYKSLKDYRFVNLIGANSVDDHGKFVYNNYVGNIPFVGAENFLQVFKNIIQEFKIDAVFPTMDSIITVLKKHESYLGCNIISSDYLTTEICLSKFKTYDKLKNIVDVPFLFEDIETCIKFPVFLKPEIGYGSKGVKKAKNINEIREHLNNFPDSLIMEYLPGDEFTVDCFTNHYGELLFVGPRQRKRISKGISVNTATMLNEDRFNKIAEKINKEIKFNGSWFFQVKERGDKTLVLMEIACRMAGSSSVYRMKGVNLSLLSILNYYKKPISIITNEFDIELDRALDNCFNIKTELNFQNVYLDYDDLIVKSKVNVELIGILHQFINYKKNLYLFVRNNSNLEGAFKEHGLLILFKCIFEIKENEMKWEFIDYKESIFIDNSFLERDSVKKKLNIPVFSLDMIAGLAKNLNKSTSK